MSQGASRNVRGCLRVAVLALLSCAGLPGCHSTGATLHEAEDYGHSYVEEPYNTDGRGNDLPLVVGTFSVPAEHAAGHTAAQTIQVGYTRYLAENSDGDSALVILSDPLTEAALDLDIVSLRRSMDVVVFHRRGSGPSAPPVACGLLPFPLARPMSIQALREAAERHTDRCLGAWEAANLPQAALADVEVAHDLYDLSRVIGKQRFYLVLERSTTRIGVAAALRYPDLIAGIILTDPGISARELAAAYRSRLEDAGSDIARQARLLDAELRKEPVVVHGETRSGTPATVAIGPLDYAFVASRYLSGAEDVSELLAAITRAANGDYKALATLVLEVRKEIGFPGLSLLVASANHGYLRPADEGDPMQFAIDWPVSAFRTDAGGKNLDLDRLRLPILVLKREEQVCIDGESSALPDRGQANVQVYGVSGYDWWLDRSGALTDAIQAFVAGEPVTEDCAAGPKQRLNTNG